MRARSILSATFDARIEAVEALLAARDAKQADPRRLRDVAGALDEVSGAYEYTPTASVYAALGEFLRTVALLVEWRAAVLQAEPEADRFFRAAQERFRLWCEEEDRKKKIEPAVVTLRAVASQIESMSSLGDVTAIVTALARTPLPIGVYEAEHRPRIPGGGRRCQEERPEQEPPEDLAVAFVKFMLDGQPAAETHFLEPYQVHDLSIEVRVNRWPSDAESLELRPVSIEAAETYELPVFSLTRPAGEPPFVMRAEGRAVIKVAQSLHARPFEFKYTAQFTPRSTEQPVAVVGQRTLRIEGLDFGRVSLTGYRNLDTKIVSLRDQLRGQRMVTPEELGDILLLLGALANYAGRALQDNLVPEIWDEQRFQRELRDDLRRRADIGGRLEEHPHAGGGETDLSLGGVRLELKSVRDRTYRLADCEAFVDQTVSYAVATGKRVALLCVLDCSPKHTPPFPADEGLGIFQRGTSGPPVCVVTVLVQGNLARPSEHSRRSGTGKAKPRKTKAVDKSE